jgi:hypothetical protein
VKGRDGGVTVLAANEAAEEIHMSTRKVHQVSFPIDMDQLIQEGATMNRHHHLYTLLSS